jgi:hypothetical protein
VGNTRKFRDSWGSVHLVSALAMTRSGMNVQAETLLSNWRDKFPESPAAAWASAKLSGDETRAGEVLAGLEPATSGYPWNLSRIDREFPVVLEILRLIGSPAKVH